MTTSVKPKRKSLGTLAFSQKVNEYQLFNSARELDIRSKVMLHANGDWGDLAPEDDMDLTQFSEQDYCNTVILFPEEY